MTTSSLLNDTYISSQYFTYECTTVLLEFSGAGRCETICVPKFPNTARLVDLVSHPLFQPLWRLQQDRIGFVRDRCEPSAISGISWR